MLSLPLVLIIAPPILLALTIHEFAHAYVAHSLGDDTASAAGRLTLNPLAHLDLLGTIMVFIVSIGWAKPVPVNPNNLANPRKDMLWISLAGPASNVALALVFGILCRILNVQSLFPVDYSALEIIKSMAAYGMVINLILAFFNIIPLPPLDGSKILSGLLPPRYDAYLQLFTRYGHFVLLFLIVLSVAFNIPVFRSIYLPFVRILSYLFGGISFI